MPKAAFCGVPHSESEVYDVKSSTIGREPPVSRFCTGKLTHAARHKMYLYSNPQSHSTFRKV